MHEDDVIGITSCDECQTRLKVRRKYLHMEGKTVRCPKCHNLFTCHITQPTPVEQAALQNEERQQTAERRKRRTRAEIRQEHLDRVSEGFRRLHPRLSEIALAAQSSEEEVRRWCLDALKEALSYSDSDIDTEVRVLGRRLDIALKRDGKIFMVLECKNIRMPLRPSVRDQVATYATSVSADWAVITNGQIWKLYRVMPQQGADPKFIEVFDVDLLDDDGVSETDVEHLYLLTARAVFGGDLAKACHVVAASSKRRVLQALASERLVRALRLELADSYRQEHGEYVALEDDHVRGVVAEMFGLLEL